MSLSDATALIYNLDLSVNKYQELRLELLPKLVLPTRNTVDSFKASLLPPGIQSNHEKTYCNIENVVSNTVNSLLKVSGNGDNENLKIIHVDAKFGIDGSGSHSYRHQVSSMIDENDLKGTNYIGSFWCPLFIRDSHQNLIWTNPVPNSIIYARPVTLVKAKETRESIKEYFQPTLVKLSSFESEPIVNNEGTDIFVKTEISMVDGKMVGLFVGDSGSFCHYCNVTRAEANDLSTILQSFKIEKSFEEVKKIWEKLEHEEIRYSDRERKGQCHEPLASSDVKFFAILHQKICSLDQCLKLLYHLVSGQRHTWSESNPSVKSAVKIAKVEVIETVRQKTGILLDSPTSDGGNTNSGPVADRFFSVKERENICSVIQNEDHREKFNMLLSKFNVLLSITQHVDSQKIVDTEVCKSIGYDLMIFFKQSFPWAMITPSVHQMCAHSWELFVMTEGSPIAVYSEQSGECWNKFICAYKSGMSCKARQMSVQVNTKDIFTRIMIRTHPEIASRKRVLKCSKCSHTGHTARGAKPTQLLF